MKNARNEALAGPVVVMEHCCPVVELRQYTLHPHTRDTLVRVFDEHFVETQEQHGMCIIGQFRDLTDPDRFVWIRSFSDMESRTRALEAFYSGPVWKEHGPVANATMIDHTNVLLLRPADRHAGFRFDARLRPAPDGPDVADGVVVATIHYLSDPASPAVIGALRGEISAAVSEGDGVLLAQLVTEPAPNPVSRLPVREGVNVFVWLASYPSEIACRRSTMSAGLAPERERLLLQPTRRSFLRHRPDPRRAPA